MSPSSDIHLPVAAHEVGHLTLDQYLGSSSFDPTGTLRLTMNYADNKGSYQAAKMTAPVVVQ
jgi:hypothetical protein